MQKTSRVISAWSMCPILIIAAEWLEILQLLLATILLGRSKILLLWQERQRSWRPFLQLYWKVLLATSVQLLVGTTARLLFTLSWGLAWRSQAGMFSLCIFPAVLWLSLPPDFHIHQLKRCRFCFDLYWLTAGPNFYITYRGQLHFSVFSFPGICFDRIYIKQCFFLEISIKT